MVDSSFRLLRYILQNLLHFFAEWFWNASKSCYLILRNSSCKSGYHRRYDVFHFTNQQTKIKWFEFDVLSKRNYNYQNQTFFQCDGSCFFECVNLGFVRSRRRKKRFLDWWNVGFGLFHILNQSTHSKMRIFNVSQNQTQGSWRGEVFKRKVTKIRSLTDLARGRISSIVLAEANARFRSTSPCFTSCTNSSDAKLNQNMSEKLKIRMRLCSHFIECDFLWKRNEWIPNSIDFFFGRKIFDIFVFIVSVT